MLTRKMSPLLNINGSASCVPTETKLFITLWTLGNLESFRGIGDRFGMQMGKEFIYLRNNKLIEHLYLNTLDRNCPFYIPCNMQRIPNQLRGIYQMATKRRLS